MNNQEILDALEFTTTCDIGSPGCYGEGQMIDCQRPAVWSLHYHACNASSPVTGPGTAAWCEHHLRMMRFLIEGIIADNENPVCPCGHPYNTPSDFMWGATPLVTRPSTGPQK